MKQQSMKKQSPFGQESGKAACNCQQSRTTSASVLKELMNPSNLNYFGAGSIDAF